MQEDRVARFIRLTAFKRDLEQNLKEVTRKLDLAEPIVSNILLANGSNSYSTPEGTVYFTKHVYASLKTGADGTLSDSLASLRSHNLGHLIKETVLPQDLRAWAKEVDATNQQLPDDLKEHVAISRTHTLKVRIPHPKDST